MIDELQPKQIESLTGSQIEDLAFFGPPEVFGPLHDMSLSEWQDAQRLAQIRNELAYPPGVFLDGDPDKEFQPIELPTLPSEEGGEIGMLKKKDNKRKQREVKEKSPKLYTERLLVVNDLQLLRSADDEAIGAFIRYGEDTGSTVSELVINGDLTDNERMSVFPKMPQGGEDITGDEIEATKWFIKKCEQMFPNAKLTLIFGNHDKERYYNYFKGHEDGIEHYIRPYEEVMGLEKWNTIEYGSGSYYRFKDRIIWHGHKSGKYVANSELQNAGVSVTTAHTNKNQYIEDRDALGNLKSGIVVGGFSKDNLHFMKTANTKWSQGFLEIFWDPKVGEQPYMVIMKHGNPRFIGPNGRIYDGSGFNLRQEIGLDPKPARGRGRPRKS